MYSNVVWLVLHSIDQSDHFTFSTTKFQWPAVQCIYICNISISTKVQITFQMKKGYNSRNIDQWITPPVL